MDEYLTRRRAIAAKYDSALASSSLGLPVQNSHGRHAYYLYVVRHPRRDEWLEALKQRDIHLNVSYRWPIHTMRGYAHLGHKEGDLPHTESAAREIFSLPMYPSLGNDEQDRVIASLLEIDKSLA